MTFRTRLSKVLFPKRSAKMTDGIKKRKRQLAFEFQRLRFKLSFQNYWNFDLERKHGNKNSFSGPKSTGTIEKRVPGALFLPLSFHTEGKSYLYTFGNGFHSTFQILRIQLVL